MLSRLQKHVLGELELSAEQITAAKFLIERTVPRAEAPREVHHSGSLTLEQLITGQVNDGDDVGDIPSVRPN